MKKKINVTTKIFAYTILLVLLICLAGMFLFSREFLSYYRSEQRRVLYTSFEPLLAVMADRGKNPDELAEMARTFADNNQSFRFIIRGEDGNTLFSTPNAEGMSDDDFPPGLRMRFANMTRSQDGSSENAYIFIGYNSDSNNINYQELVKRSLLALSLMLLIAILGAVLFVKKITKPLEDEIIRQRMHEENQRLFFSAASHELKTPIAAARALVEGMIAGVGDYSDHQKYLRECLKTLDDQTHLVLKIIEIVKVSDRTVSDVSAAVNLADLGNSVLAEHRPLAQQRRLQIQGLFPDVCVHAEWNLLKLVISNIVSNAIQNTKENEIIKIETIEGKDLRLCILNTGAYIPDDLLERIFEPFNIKDSARTQNSQSGLGLTIVKKALDSMKIPFALENTKEGVLFWMALQIDYRKTTDKIQ